MFVNFLRGIGIFLLAAVFLRTCMWVSDRVECVVLPNRATIEHATFFPQSFPVDNIMDMTLRDADGQILVVGDPLVRFLWHPSDERKIILSYRSDQIEEMEMYHFGILELIFGDNVLRSIRKKSEYDDRNIITTGLQLIFRELRDHPEYTRSWCKRDWFQTLFRPPYYDPGPVQEPRRAIVAPKPVD